MPYMMGHHSGASASPSRSGSPRRQARMRRHFSCTSQPMLVRSGSSPAVVSTITACCRRAASEPAVRTSHSRRLGWAWSSSMMMAENENPCLVEASLEYTFITPPSLLRISRTLSRHHTRGACSGWPRAVCSTMYLAHW